MTEAVLAFSILAFVTGFMCGSAFKENQLSYRLNRIRSDVDAIKIRLGIRDDE